MDSANETLLCHDPKHTLGICFVHFSGTGLTLKQYKSGGGGETMEKAQFLSCFVLLKVFGDVRDIFELVLQLWKKKTGLAQNIIPSNLKMSAVGCQEN